jgi:aminoglycoside phosphotransferase (APT) family kinase protein
MITEAAVAAALGGAWSTIEIQDVRPLLGGQWAAMAHVRVAGAPGDTPADVVVRVVPDAALGAKELAVQRAAAEAGIPTPRVHLTGDAGGPLGGAWAVMDFVAGRQLLAGLDGAAAVRQLPALLRDLPRQLAGTMAAIHGIDPAPVAAAARAAAPTAALTVEEVWGHLHAATDDLPQLRAALERLHATRPHESEVVVCHGDLHPLNLLVDAEGVITVLDWTAAAVAPPAFDVALTTLLLRNPPLDAPALLRPVIRGGGRVLASRFLRAYRAAVPGADLGSLGWYTALHSTRVLIDLHGWEREGDPRASTHPWHIVAPGAVGAVRRATGVDVGPG